MRVYRLYCIVLTLALVFGLAACSDYRDKDKLKNRSTSCTQPGSFFPEGEQRYILVDESTQRIGGEDIHCYIYADRYTHVMYEYQIRHSGSNWESATMFQLEYEDGSPIVYNDDKW